MMERSGWSETEFSKETIMPSAYKKIVLILFFALSIFANENKNFVTFLMNIHPYIAHVLFTLQIFQNNTSIYKLK